jgi:hypothetical protein
MPRACLICADPNKTKLAAEMIGSGKSDELIAKTLGGLSRGSARRHRVNHVEREVRAVLQAANRTRDIRAERHRIVAAAEAGDVNAASWLSIERIAEAVRRVEMRLERVSQAAELEGRHLAVAALAGQELKAATVAARLGGLGGYAPPRRDPSDAQPFVLNIQFRGGRTERIEGTPMHPDDPAFNAQPSVPHSIGDRDLELSGREDEDAGSFDEDV